MKPKASNFCGGNFQDWLEVNLIDKCNGRCEWCIEKKGWHPEYHAPWWVIVEAALKTGKTNIILLGGEPTLHPCLDKIIRVISAAGRKVWLTTNGSMLSPRFAQEKLTELTGINISIHSYFLEANKRITGVKLDRDVLMQTISALHGYGVSVRFNCNCISGHIDNSDEIGIYVRWARELGADKIRFAELKQDDGGFVDLAEEMHYKYGLSDDPFRFGCNQDAVIDGMPVNFRQMCGLQTTRRVRPEDPEQELKQVLYYDGNIYNGWQQEADVTDGQLKELLKAVALGNIPIEEAMVRLKSDWVRKEIEHEEEREGYERALRLANSNSGAGCQY
jgi:hypothetical protein